MSLIHTLKNPADLKFDLYFLGYDGAGAVSPQQHWTDREGLLELTHNHGSERDASFAVNHGNAEPFKGFGHVCVSVDNLQAACARLEQAGHAFQKRLSDGRMRHIAFVLDPDGYWVEIIGQKPLEETEGVGESDVGSYRLNHTMIRVKDAQKSLAFYQEVMGMKLKRTVEMAAASFNLYFLGYGEMGDEGGKGVSPVAGQEGLLELTWNYGTEKDEEFRYHSGNEDPQGFGHICITVDDLDQACKRFEERGVTWKKRQGEGKLKPQDIAFLFGEFSPRLLGFNRWDWLDMLTITQIQMVIGLRFFRTRSSSRVLGGD